jgi:YHS domain-containing protein
MKYAFAFLAAFALLAGATAYVRVLVSDDVVAQHRHGNGSTPQTAEEEEDPHKGHGHSERPAQPPKAADEKGKAAEEEKAVPEWGGEVSQDLKNAKDPVSGNDVGADHDAHAHLVYHGFQIHFEDERTAARFKRRPVQFMQKLELELTSDGKVLKVDASKYQDPPSIPEECPMMGGDITKEDEVYILHRGWRIYFCCWSGCATDFLKEPGKHYAAYGLVEKDGKLVKRE